MIIAGTLVLLYDWRLVDPLVTVMIAGYILWQSFQEIGSVFRILMLGSPPDIPASDVLARMKAISGVEDVRHVHFWQLDEHSNAVDAHMVVQSGAWSEADRIKAIIKSALRTEFSISHSTLELECAAHGCDDANAIGHGPANKVAGAS